MNTSDKKLMYVLVALPAIIIAYALGVNVGEDKAMSAGNPSATNGNYVTGDQFEPFWKAWSVLQQKNINAASTTVQDRIWGSIEGLAASYDDPYTVFFPPAESKMFQEDIAGNFGGVGMEIGKKDGRIVVVAPLKGSPAERAGVRAGDAILAVNGTSTVGMASDVAVRLIRGPRGTDVTITFLPEGESKTVDRTITRETINVPIIETERKPGGIFVIKLFSFTGNSPDLFRNALREFVLSGDNKLILDLRGNPGGYLDAAWDMASWFLPVGKVIVTEDFGLNREPHAYRSKGYDVFNDNLRMMILADGSSASASEILAGALQVHGVAEIVGTETFGKGSVQELVPITSDTSLKVTIASWLTPDGHNLSQGGLEPDYEVEVSDEDVEAGRDPQMAKAVELLSAR